MITGNTHTHEPSGTYGGGEKSQRFIDAEAIRLREGDQTFFIFIFHQSFQIVTIIITCFLCNDGVTSYFIKAPSRSRSLPRGTAPISFPSFSRATSVHFPYSLIRKSSSTEGSAPNLSTAVEPSILVGSI